MGRLCSVDGEILFRWGRLWSDTESPEETSFQPRRESISGETLFRDTGPLAHLVNLSLNTATVPKQWKTAVIRPVPKVSQPPVPVFRDIVSPSKTIRWDE